MTHKTIAYILAEFPSHTETFILKEALYINESFPLYIFALKKGKSRMDDQHYKAFENGLIYIPHYMSPKVISTHLRLLFRQKEWMQEWKHLIWNMTHVGLRQSMHQAKLLLICPFIAKKIKQLNVAHLHAHFANYPTEVAKLVSQFSGIPYSFTAHANDIYVDSQNLPEKIRQASFVTTCTRYNKNWLDALVSSAEQKKIQLIYHGVDLTYWEVKKNVTLQKPIHILTIGRLIEKKGFIFLLEAVRKLSCNEIEIQLHIVGKGKDDQKLKYYCRKHNLEHIVIFKGWQTPEQVRHLYAGSDMFVLPSIVASDGDRDGIPNVILEAMASGLPVISTPISGIPEIIQHQYNGLLVPEKDSDRLAEAISTLINDNALRTILIENAHKTIVQQFDCYKCNLLLKKLLSTPMEIPIHIRRSNPFRSFDIGY